MASPIPAGQAQSAAGYSIVPAMNVGTASVGDLIVVDLLGGSAASNNFPTGGGVTTWTLLGGSTLGALSCFSFYGYVTSAGTAIVGTTSHLFNTRAVATRITGGPTSGDPTLNGATSIFNNIQGSNGTAQTNTTPSMGTTKDVLLMMAGCFNGPGTTDPATGYTTGSGGPNGGQSEQYKAVTAASGTQTFSIAIGYNAYNYNFYAIQAGGGAPPPTVNSNFFLFFN